MMAASGQVQCWCSECLRPAAWSQIVAQGVTSLPVPAVVGMAISALWPAAGGPALLQGLQQFAETPRGRGAHQRLGRVDGAAAAQGHDARDLGVFAVHAVIQRGQPLHIGIGRNAVHHAAQLAAQPLAQLLHQAQGFGLGKRHQQAVAPGQQLGQAVQAAGAGMDGNGVVIGPHKSVL